MSFCGVCVCACTHVLEGFCCRVFVCAFVVVVVVVVFSFLGVYFESRTYLNNNQLYILNFNTKCCFHLGATR